MSKLSLKDKLSIFIEISKNTELLILIIIFLVILGIMLYKTTEKNKKKTRLIYIGSTVLLIMIFIITYHSSLTGLFSYMMNNLFVMLYFPNIAIYFFAIILTNIILLVTLFSYKSSNIIKKVNTVIYIIMNYLLILIINVINNNQIDIFTTSTIYQNKELTALIELSSIIFVVWIIYLILYKAMIIYLKKEYKPPVKRLIRIKKVKKLPENYSPILSPMKVERNNLKKQNQELLDTYSQMFTLDDYKLMLKILKGAKPLNEEKDINRSEPPKTDLEKLYSSLK